jgi:hypothetical protein
MTWGKMVWDQHTHYFESRGEVRDPRAMFKSDLLGLLQPWKATGEEILLFGDFNENVSIGPLARSLAEDEFLMVEVCHCTTGIQLPPTHIHDWSPIDVVFGTSGLSCQLATLLPSRVGVEDHWIFLLDVDSATLIGNVFPCIIPLSGQLFNCSSDEIKNN